MTGTPFDPAIVRKTVLALNSGEYLPGSALAGYCSFYRLEFTDRYPNVRHDFSVVDSGVHRLAVQTFTLPGSEETLLLVHGYFDHVGLYGHLVEYGLSRGLSVMAFDLPGHGLSSGEAAVIDDFADYSQAVIDCMAAYRQLLPQRWYCIAQSTGGSAVMQLLLNPGSCCFKAVVLLAPLVRPLGWWWVRVLHGLIHRWRDYVPRRFAQNSQDGLFLEFLRADPLQARQVSTRWVGALKRWLNEFLVQPSQSGSAVCPILVVQGTGDQTVDWQFNLPQVQRVFPGSRQTIIEEARHHLANESVEIRAQVVTEIDAFFGFQPTAHGGVMKTPGNE